MQSLLRFSASLLAIVTFASLAVAQAPKPQAAPPAEKTYTVSFDETPWPAVLDWFSKESGLTYIDKEKLKGTITFKSDRKLTWPQVIDELNASLATQKMTLIRRSQTFLVHPSDAKIPTELVSMITIEELAMRGETEVVQVIIPLTKVSAEEIVPQIEKLLGEFGTVKAFDAKHIIILDTAKNIRIAAKSLRVVQGYIKSKEEAPPGKSKEEAPPGLDQFNYQCKYVRASAMIVQLRTLLEDPKPAKLEKENNDAKGWGAKTVEQKEGRIGAVSYSIDSTTGKITFEGSAKDIAAVVKVIKQIDKGDELPKDRKEFWKTYDVTPGTAEALAKVFALPEFKGSGIQVLVIGTSQLQVYGSSAVHNDIEKYLKKPKPEK
jgi:type II secretory pathway component GspD/PulD (secretin)